MANFSWKDEYSIGDAMIDSQHRHLFNLANKLVDSKDQAEATNNAMKLFRYVREHFSDEEAVMRKTGYPAVHEHVLLHEDLITRLSIISSDICQDQWSMDALKEFMNQWLLVHIVKEDTKIGRYVAK